jgi:hypothetical protein
VDDGTAFLPALTDGAYCRHKVNRAPKASELRASVGPLASLLALLPDLQAVLLLGAEARQSWRLLTAGHPWLTDGLEVLATRHTSRQAFIGTAQQRAGWLAAHEETFRQAGPVLASGGGR